MRSAGPSEPCFRLFAFPTRLMRAVGGCEPAPSIRVYRRASVITSQRTQRRLCLVMRFGARRLFHDVVHRMITTAKEITVAIPVSCAPSIARFKGPR